MAKLDLDGSSSAPIPCLIHKRSWDLPPRPSSHKHSTDTAATNSEVQDHAVHGKEAAHLKSILSCSMARIVVNGAPLLSIFSESPGWSTDGRRWWWYLGTSLPSVKINGIAFLGHKWRTGFKQAVRAASLCWEEESDHLFFQQAGILHGSSSIPFAEKKNLTICICHGMKVNKASLDVLITAISERLALDIPSCRLRFC